MSNEFRISELERRLDCSVVVGKVDFVSSKGVCVRIGDAVTAELPVLSYRELEVGDVVLVINHYGEFGHGFVVGSLSQDRLRNFRLRFGDGTAIKYDQQAKALRVSTPGSLEATAAQMTLNGPVSINGTLSVTGTTTLSSAAVGGTLLIPGGDQF